ncbi:MAG: LLM class flavin-dependent oxidoreductase [Williamsia herbipolensis]|nr:LLM class flavin-dependent oxidoreductase [Williamsia herbipolensis]
MTSSPERSTARRREVTVALQTDKTPQEYATLAQVAERCGFDGVSVFADLGFQPPAPAMTCIAGATRRVRLGVACHSPAHTHPVDIAAQVATLDLFSGGRAYCGLARGAWLDGLGVPPAGGLDRLTESVAAIRLLLAGDDRGHDGRYVQVPAGFRLQYPLPAGPADMLIGTWGRRTARRAGDLGVQEVKIGGTANPAMIGLMRSWLPSEVRVVAGAVTVCDRDGDRARALARRQVCLYLDVVGGLDPTLEIDPALLHRLRTLVASPTDDDARRAADLVDDPLLDAFTFAGTPEQIAAHAGACLDAGADRIEFGTPHGIDPVGGIELLGTIVPGLRG